MRETSSMRLDGDDDEARLGRTEATSRLQLASLERGVAELTALLRAQLLDGD